MDEEKIVMGSRANEVVKCSNCGKEITVEQRTSYQGKDGEDIYFCEECMKAINEEIAQETQNPNIILAIILGIIAGVVCTILWTLITVITGKYFGIIAIGVGWLIAQAVMLGAGKKKGTPLQIISSIITLIGLIMSEFVLWASFNPEASFFSFIGPIGLVIWGIAIYTAYITPRATKL